MYRVLIIRAMVAAPARDAVYSELRGRMAGDGRCPPTQDDPRWHGERLEWG
jgi:hypothetical protein